MQLVRGATEALFETHFPHDSEKRLESGRGFPPRDSTESRNELSPLWEVNIPTVTNPSRLVEIAGGAERLKASEGQGTGLSQLTLALSAQPSTHRAKQ